MKTTTLRRATLMALCAAVLAPAALAQKYKADVPKSILTPDVVETERLGTLKFFAWKPS